MIKCYLNCNKVKKVGRKLLGKLQIILEKPKDRHLNVNVSSMLQGVLMELISYESATEFHNGGRQPYSQHVQIQDKCLVWNIHTLTKQAYDQIIVPMLDDSIQKIYLRHKDLELKILDKKKLSISYDQLRKDYYFTDGSRYQTIRFVTPTAFKSKGEYIFYPSVHFLFQSLMMKYDVSSDDADIFGEDVMEHFEENIKIVRYKLRSYDFHLEGTKIPAFLGEITLKMNGPQALVNLADYLLKYGEYSGVGIKCGIGMGGIERIEERGKR